MTDRKFRHLSRKQLVDIIYELQKQEKSLQDELSKTQAALHSRELKYKDAGSIAQAALGLHDVFQKAQEAADHYLEQICRTNDRADEIIEQARQEAERILEDARTAVEAIAEQTHAEDETTD